MTLTLRKTVGETADDDYAVIHDGRSIGRIRLATERSWQGVVWTWNINPPLPVPPWCSGTEDTLDEAKSAFKAAWERFYAGLTPDQIESWHDTQDTAAGNKS